MKRGFTLLEMTVVIGIIALLIGGGLAIQLKATEQRSAAITHEKLHIILQAIDDFTDHHGYIPCPANPLLVNTASTYGVEANNSDGTCNSTGTNIVRRTVGSTNVAFGMVPLHTLGLPALAAQDGWGNRITYTVFEPATFVGDGTFPTGGTTGYTGQPAINANAMSVVINDSGATTHHSNIVVSILSHGPNEYGAWFGTGSSRHDTTGAPTLDASNLLFVTGTAYPNRVILAHENGDDILYHLTKWQIDQEWKK